MRYETWRGLDIPKIGFGTWKIGGGSFAKEALDVRDLAALRSALEVGYTHFDTAELYAGGHAEELLGRAVKESAVPRRSLFITSKLKPEHLRYDAVLRSCEGSLRRLGMDYLDLYLIHWPGGRMRLPETFRALNKLVDDRRVLHLGVSNFGLELLRSVEELAETPIMTNQVPYSLQDRGYVRNGVFEYCRGRGILLTAYSPLDQGHFRPSKTLQTIAAARGVSAQEIALAWLVTQPGVITIPMSRDPVHQRQNLEAGDIVLTEREMSQLQ